MSRVHIYAPPGHFHINVWTLDGHVESVACGRLTTQDEAITKAMALSSGYDYWRGTQVVWVDDDGWNEPTFVWQEGQPPL